MKQWSRADLKGEVAKAHLKRLAKHYIHTFVVFFFPVELIYVLQ